MSAEAIVRAFERFKMPTSAIDRYEAGGREKLLERISAFTLRGVAVSFAMVGFPFKSMNHRDKTIGVLPDKAEEISVYNFSAFLGEIAAVYPRGAELNIASDGYMFNDLLGESDNVVAAYRESMSSMVRGISVNIIGLECFYPRKSLATARAKAIEHFGISEVELERQILFEPNITTLYRGMIRFMEEELAFKTFGSKNQLHKEAKSLARRMMFRNMAYVRLVAHEFGSSVRLSMHQSTNNGEKYSFQLIPGEKSWASPWHCALLLDAAGGIATIHRKDAEAAGYKLRFNGDQPYYFEEAK